MIGSVVGEQCVPDRRQPASQPATRPRPAVRVEPPPQATVAPWPAAMQTCLLLVTSYLVAVSEYRWRPRRLHLQHVAEGRRQPRILKGSIQLFQDRVDRIRQRLPTSKGLGRSLIPLLLGCRGATSRRDSHAQVSSPLALLALPARRRGRAGGVECVREHVSMSIGHCHKRQQPRAIRDSIAKQTLSCCCCRRRRPVMSTHSME